MADSTGAGTVDESAGDAPDDGSAGTRSQRLVGVAVAFAVGLAAFAVTALVRSGGDGAAPAPTDGVVADTAQPTATVDTGDGPDDSTSEDDGDDSDSDSETVDDSGSPPPRIVEVDLQMHAPIPADADGRPLAPPEFYEGPGSPDSVVSPAVGTVTVAYTDGPGGDLVAAPPVLAGGFGSAPPTLEETIAEPADADDLDTSPPPVATPVPPGIDTEATLAVIEETGADYDAAAAAAAEAAVPPDATDAPADDTEGGTTTSGATEPDGAPRLADPCADEPDPERCPDPGEAGTIVETFALTVPPILRVRILVPGAELCGPTETSRFEHRIAIESTTPLSSFEMTYWRAGWPTGEYLRTFTLSTPADEADAWMSEFAASTTDPPAPIVHCTTLTDLRPDWGYQYHADAVDTFDRPWTTRGGTPPRFAGPDAVVPPTFLLRLSDNELLISAPHRAEQSVAILAYPRNDEPLDAPIDPCTGVSRVVTGFDLPHSPINPDRIDVARTTLADNGWDPDYVHRTIGTMRLAEGTDFRVCVHTSTGSPSFSAGREQTLAYDVSTPDALSLTFRVLRVDGADQGIEAERLSVSVEPAGRGVMVPFPWCGIWRNQGLLRGDTEVGAEICTSDPRSSDLFSHGARLKMVATDVEGARREHSVFVPTRTCRMPCVIPEPEVFVFDLPSGRTQTDFWCGLFGDDCDSASDESFGTITIEVSYGNPGGNIRSAWGVSDPLEVGDQRPPTPETPQLDTLQSISLSGDPTAPTITVPVVADRPVTARVELLNSIDAGPPCTVGDRSNVATADAFSETHEFAFTDLCPGQNVIAVVELTDEEDRTSRWHGLPGTPAYGPADAWYRGIASVPPFRVVASADVSVVAPTPAVRFARYDLSISGRPVNISPLIRTTGSGCLVPRGDAVTSLSRRSRTEPDRRVGASTDRTVEIEFVVEAELLQPGCTPAVDEQPPAFAASVVIDWDDITLDEPITVSARLPVPELGPDAFIDATANVTIHEVSR